MGNQTPKKVVFGSALRQKADGTWESDFEMDVADHERVPATHEELLEFVKKSIPDKFISTVAKAALEREQSHLDKAIEIASAVHSSDDKEATEWKTSRKVMKKDDGKKEKG